MDEFSETIEKIKQTLSSPQGTLKDITLRCAAGARTVIFGAGNCGHRVYALLNFYQVPKMIFCDNNRKGTVDNATGLRIVGLEDLRQDREKYLILVSVADMPVYEEMYHQLLQQGFEKEQIFLYVPLF